MSRYVLLGSSGSGKSTLAARLARAYGLAHLDLDRLAWEPEPPPRRRPLEDSKRDIVAFMDANPRWVIEGCYADLLETTLLRCTELFFLNPGVEACVVNARLRPWESHKYPSKEAQDANLEMLIDWIRSYTTRTDTFSLASHRALFDAFAGPKRELTSRETVAASAPSS
jgi:adenylate kinase family enzyme